MQQMFLGYCNGKVTVGDLVNEIVTKILANPDLARQLGLTLGVIVQILEKSALKNLNQL